MGAGGGLRQHAGCCGDGGGRKAVPNKFSTMGACGAEQNALWSRLFFRRKVVLAETTSDSAGVSPPTEPDSSGGVVKKVISYSRIMELHPWNSLQVITRPEVCLAPPDYGHATLLSELSTGHKPRTFSPS